MIEFETKKKKKKESRRKNQKGKYGENHPLIKIKLHLDKRTSTCIVVKNNNTRQKVIVGGHDVLPHSASDIILFYNLGLEKETATSTEFHFLNKALDLT